jgi:DHA2 family multidrug resistance protein-like MFS transporter
MGRHKWWPLAALAIASMAIGLDMTVLNLALPTLSTALHASTDQLLWFVDAYTLVLAAAMLPAGMLGDRYGRKKLLLASLTLFGLGSLACAYAPSAAWFIAARITLGLGAAFIMPLSLSVVPVLFTDEERPKAVSILMIGALISFPLGPLLGGWLLTHYWWGTVFLINVPVVALAILAVAWLLPESRSGIAQSVDLVGILLSSLGLTGLTYGVIEGGQHGFGSGGSITPLASGLIILFLFVWWERRVKDPLVELELFRSKGFTWGTTLTTLVSFVMFGVLFATPQYFQEVLGFDAFHSGIRLLPLIAGLIVGAGIANRLAAKAGDKWAVALGFAILSIGVITAAQTDMQSASGFATAWLSISGLGLGFAMPTAMDAALGALTEERSGVGSAVIQAVRQAGGTIGVAILGTVLSTAYRGHLQTLQHLPPALAKIAGENIAAGIAVANHLALPALLQAIKTAFVHGMDNMLWVSAAIGIINVFLTLTFLPNRPKKVGEVK